MSGRALALAAVAAAALTAGCSKHQTETILVITTEGVRVPDDVRALHVVVADRNGSLDDTVYDADVELCNPTLSSSCYDLPVTATLYPGKKRPGDSVRVQVDAVGGGGVVISDAALFTFANEQSLRLDFVLYGNCLGNVACSKRDQACGPLDTCIDLHPGPAGNGPLDLALPVTPTDMSVTTPPDLTPVDLAGADLIQAPPDLVTTLDLAGCAGVQCDMGEQCIAGVCQPCGYLDGPCCFTGGPGLCDQTNLECNGNSCVHCGSDGELCCSMTVPACLSPDNCINNRCQMPAMPDMGLPSSDMALKAIDGGLSLGDML